MDTILGEDRKYLLIQNNKETGEELTLNYNEYSGMFNPSYEVNNATRFESLEMVEQLCTTQNMIAQIMGQKYEYYVVEENVIRTKKEETEK